MLLVWISGGVFFLVVVILFPQDFNYSSRNGQLRETLEILGRTENDGPGKSEGTLYHRYCKPRIRGIQKLADKWLPAENSCLVKQRLIQAGLDRKFSPEDFRGLKLTCALVAVSYVLLLAMAEPSAKSGLIGASMIWLAFRIPDEWVNRRVKRRKTAIARELPVLLNTLAILTEAGLNLVPAIQEVCRRGRGVLVEELRLALREVAMGQSQGTAFTAMAQRCGEPELGRFVSVLVQGLEKGSSGVVKILKSQAGECWLNRRKHAEEMGQKASFKLFLPLLIFFFPAMTMFVLGPALLTLIKSLNNF